MRDTVATVDRHRTPGDAAVCEPVALAPNCQEKRRSVDVAELRAQAAHVGLEPLVVERGRRAPKLRLKVRLRDDRALREHQGDEDFELGGRHRERIALPPGEAHRRIEREWPPAQASDGSRSAAAPAAGSRHARRREGPTNRTSRVGRRPRRRAGRPARQSCRAPTHPRRRARRGRGSAGAASRRRHRRRARRCCTRLRPPSDARSRRRRRARG